MLARVLMVGLLAGLAAGLAIALVQQATTAPLILKAEVYERAAEAAPSHHHHGTDTSHDEGWKPEDGLPRFLFTSVATVATAVGICFLLMAGMLLTGGPIDERRALGWALAGFAAAGLAPAVGLAPELPGAAGADLVARQIWWVGTAVATAFALWLLLRTNSLPIRLVALAIFVAPHLIGAPHPHAFESRVPAELAAQFTANSLVVQGLLWVLAGLAVGFLWPRVSRRPAA